MAHFQRKDKRNYAQGGLRLWVDEVLDASTTPVKRRGMLDLGCIEEGPIKPDVQFNEHFCSYSGTRTKDRKIVKQISMSIDCKLVEPDVENCRLFFYGGDITTNAAGTGTVTEEVMRAETGKATILRYSRSATSIVVKSFDGLTTYDVDDDYVIGDYYGFKTLTPVSGGAITDLSFIQVAYSYHKLANKSFAPLTHFLKECAVKLVMVSDTGPEMVGEFENCQINATGDFMWASEKFTEFTLMIDVLDNSGADASKPFGEFQHYGVGQAIGH